MFNVSPEMAIHSKHAAVLSPKKNPHIPECVFHFIDNIDEVKMSLTLAQVYLCAGGELPEANAKQTTRGFCIREL